MSPGDCTAAQTVRACLAHAAEHFAQGSRELGVSLLREADAACAKVNDPVVWAGLYLKIDQAFHKLLISRPTTETEKP
jgi:hypothetical protein